MPGNENPNRYDDIIRLPHHQSVNRPHMSMQDRAAQFAPFAALTGHADAIEETARLTDERTEPDEYELDALDMQLKRIRENLSAHPVLAVTYFCPDDKKSGGKYRIKTGAVTKLDEFEKKLVFEDGDRIFCPDIVEIQMLSSP